MKKTIDLSIIIISYNTKKLLDACLNSLYKSLVGSSVIYEVIVIDNHSTDGSQALIENKYKQVVLIKNSHNTGFGKANNQGSQKARGQTLLFLNSDTVVLDNAIEKLYRFLKTHKSDAIVGGKLFNPDQTPQSSCGPAYTLFNIFIALFLKGDYLQVTRYSPDQVKQVDWVMGACMILKKEIFIKVGRFDENIFMYMDEIDFQHRAKQLGVETWFYPDAQFVHVGAGSSQGRATPILNVFRGFIYFYKKHYNYMENLLLRIILILKSVTAIGLFMILGKKSDRDIYIKALQSVL